jgi:adenosine deaminase
MDLTSATVFAATTLASVAITKLTNSPPRNSGTRSSAPDDQPLERPNDDDQRYTRPAKGADDVVSWKSLLKNKPTQLTDDLLKKLPKIELHYHLEGAMRLSTIIDICKQQGVKIPGVVDGSDDIEPYTKHFIIEDKVESLVAFLNKMMATQSLINTYDIIERITFEACEDSFNNGVRLLEIRYSPSFICSSIVSDHSHLTVEEIHKAVKRGVVRAETQFDMAVGLIGLMDRTLPVDQESKVLDFFIAQSDDFVGIDLANDESYSCIPFAELYKRASKTHVKGLTCHAGEATNAAAVYDAVEHLGVTRVGHGFLAVEDDNVMKMLVDRKVLLEVCPISNVRTGSVESMEAHPIRKLLDAGVLVSISTDDPGMFQTTIIDEYRALVDTHAVTFDELYQCNVNALNGSFLSKEKVEKIRMKYF